VTGANPIPDSHMTATSYLGSPYNNLPQNARLHGPSAWMPSFAELEDPLSNFYLQVSLGTFDLGWVELRIKLVSALFRIF